MKIEVVARELDAVYIEWRLGRGSLIGLLVAWLQVVLGWVRVDGIRYPYAGGKSFCTMCGRRQLTSAGLNCPFCSQAGNYGTMVGLLPY